MSTIRPLGRRRPRLCTSCLWRSPATPAQAETAPVRVGVINVQRAVAQTEDGLRAQATLESFSRAVSSGSTRSKDLQRQKEEINRQSRVLSKEALQKRVDEWQKQMIDLQTVFMEYNKELKSRRSSPSRSSRR